MHLLDLTSIYPNESVDFEGRSVAALDRALVSGGARLTVMVLKPWVPRWLARCLPAYRHLAVTAGRRDDAGVEVIFCRPLRLPRLPERWRTAINVALTAGHVVRLCRRLGHRFDGVHVQGLPMAPVALRVAECLDLPLAVTLRDDLGHFDRAGVAPEYRRVFAAGRAFFAIGPGIERDLARFLPVGATTPCRLAPNGIDFGAIDAVVTRLPSSPEGWGGRIVSVGSLFRLKGFHESLAALAELRRRGVEGWSYRVVGKGPYRQELEALAGELGVADRVTFTGRLSYAETLAEMRRADIFLLPSFMEAFGNVYGEAAVCGVPAIGCLGNGPEAIIVPGETGLLVPPRDSGAVADALEQLLRDPQAARRMGAAARRHVRQLTWERTAAIYLETLAPWAGGAPSGLAGAA